MDLAVTTSPRFTAREAEKIAEQHYGIACSATPLPSERDQNFLLRPANGEWLVLKIANSDEQREVLEFQNAALERLAERCAGLRFPRMAGPLAKSGSHFVRLQSWVPGEVLAKTPHHSEELLASLGTALGQMDRALEGFDCSAAHLRPFAPILPAILPASAPPIQSNVPTPAVIFCNCSRVIARAGTISSTSCARPRMRRGRAIRQMIRRASMI